MLYEKPIKTIEWKVTRGIDLYQSDIDNFFNCVVEKDSYYEEHPLGIAKSFVNKWTEERWDELPEGTQFELIHFFIDEWTKREEAKKKIPVQLSMIDNEYKG